MRLGLIRVAMFFLGISFAGILFAAGTLFAKAVDFNPRAGALECVARIRTTGAALLNRAKFSGARLPFSAEVSRWNKFFFEATGNHPNEVVLLEVSPERWIARFEDPEIPNKYSVFLLDGRDEAGKVTGHPIRVRKVLDQKFLEQMAKEFRFRAIATGFSFVLQPQNFSAFVDQMKRPTTLAYEQVFEGGWRKVFMEKPNRQVSIVLPSRFSRASRWAVGSTLVVGGIAIATFPVIWSDYSPALGMRVGPAISFVTTKTGADDSVDFLEGKSLAKALFALEGLAEKRPGFEEALAKSLDGMGTDFYKLPFVTSYSSRVKTVNSWTARLTPRLEQDFYSSLEGSLQKPNNAAIQYLISGSVGANIQEISLDSVVAAVRWMPASGPRSHYLLSVLNYLEEHPSLDSSKLRNQILTIIPFDSLTLPNSPDLRSPKFSLAWRALMQTSSSRIQLRLLGLFREQASPEILPLLREWRKMDSSIEFKILDDRMDFTLGVQSAPGETPREALQRQIDWLIQKIEAQP